MDAPDVVGRYALYEEIAAGGMARVHLGRLLGPAGFSRTVAIKRLHSHIARDPEFASMFLDEARIAARIRHPNVVATLDVVATGEELFLVMEYVEGESLSRLERAAFRQGPIAPGLVVAMMCGVLRGVHAAHEARDERGEPLHIVHRDLTPHNILVGLDGVTRVLDFGVAKAAGKSHGTRAGEVKGKVPYMPPEQIRGTVTRRSDVYSAAVVIWEALTGQRLFKGEHDIEIMQKVLEAKVAPPSSLVPSLPRALDEVVMRGLAKDPEVRFATAEEMAAALEQCAAPASHKEVRAWVESLAASVLSRRAELVSRVESSSPGDKGIQQMTLVGPISRSSPPRDEGTVATAPAVQVPAGDATHGSVTGSVAVTAKPSGSRWVAMAGIALAMAAVLVLGIVLGRRSSAEGPAADGGAGTSRELGSPSHTNSIQSSAAGSGAAMPPGAGPDATVAATAQSGAAVPSGAPSARPAASASGRGTAPPAKTSKPPAKSSCNPPYTVDAQGVKHYKVECL